MELTSAPAIQASDHDTIDVGARAQGETAAVLGVPNGNGALIVATASIRENVNSVGCADSREESHKGGRCDDFLEGRHVFGLCWLDGVVLVG